VCVNPSSDEDAEQVFLLRDYATLKRHWRVHVRQETVLDVREAERGPNEAVQGVLERWVLAGQMTTMGFLSTARIDSAQGAPDYSKRLLILINERLLGDGLSEPRLQFQKGRFARDIDVQAKDGWEFHASYTAPWLREMVRRLNLGGTLEYDPVDFIERLIEVVSESRRGWLVD
jgi:hypothetical protein